MTHKPTVGIIGAGFSGICAAVQLKKQLGITAQIFEASDDIGGTWYHNKYPNCACDVPSHLYSLSFELNPSWSQRYSSQQEIHEYLKGVAEKYDIYSQTSLNSKVVQATWIENNRQWRLDVTDSRDEANSATVYFDIIFVSVGSLRVARIPREFESFDGPIVHTAYWDSNMDFTDKRVAVIGSGASAVQTIPALAKVTKTLYSYQRTPAWIVMRKQRHYSDFAKSVFKWVPFAARLYRLWIFLQLEMLYILFGYAQTFLGKLARNGLAAEMRNRIEKQGRAELVPLLIPDYPPGCKRLIVSENYLEALCQENIVVERSPIKQIKGRTILTEDGKENEFDILCLATGFDVQGFLGQLQVVGKNGQSLNELWRDKFPETYKSVLINGYPNLFMILGPSSLLGHNSVVIMTECQVNYAVQCIRNMIKRDIAAIEPTKEAQEAFVRDLKQRFEGTTWKGGCSSWYLNSQGEVTALWSSTVIQFWWLLRKAPRFQDFTLYERP
ncbi:hypothetical protein VTP01DRAFT_6381 [Rhizomucor pusillus]|uniref:uncharacterized protein n=1 Tax=Rhizomucor pusillus TaxID=4840 RepID=UPI003741FB77